MTRATGFEVALACAAIAGTAGCGEPTMTLVDDGLGVTRVEVNRSSSGGEPLLEIQGFDADDREVAALSLRTGEVAYSSDPGVIPEQVEHGTELVVWASEQRFVDTVPDLYAHTIARPLPESVGQFLLLPDVALELNAEAGIVYAPAQPVHADAPDGGCGVHQCDASRFPGAVDNCCQDEMAGGTRTTHVMSRAAVDRWYPNAGACRNSDLTTGCGVGGTGPCYYGPCGAGALQFYTGSDVHVFVSSTGSCGIDTGSWFAPEPFEGQAEFATITPACTCTGCLPDGTPTPVGCTNWQNL